MSFSFFLVCMYLCVSVIYDVNIIKTIFFSEPESRIIHLHGNKRNEKNEIYRNRINDKVLYNHI